MVENDIIPKSFLLQWHITEKCNWHCRHCYQEDKKYEELSTKQLLSIFDQYLDLIKKWKIPPWEASISITGGEPFVRSDIFKLLARFYKYSDLFHVAILSNGSLLDEEKIKMLKVLSMNNFQLSLEGLEAKNDLIRGKGSFQKTIDIIKLLIKNRLDHIRVSLTLTEQNESDIEGLAEYLASLGGKKQRIYLAVRRFIPWGRGAGMENSMLSPQGLRNVYRKMENINRRLAEKKYSLRVLGGCENAIYNDEIIDLNPMTRGGCLVKEGRIIAILPNGDVLPCRRLPIKIGNTLENSLENIYYSQTMTDLRDRNQDHNICMQCSNYQGCWGGAPCVSYSASGEINIPDVQCWKAATNI